MENLNTTAIIEILGTVSFAISGAFAAMQKRLDPLGVLIISFVTAIGGGTIRDLLLGDTPVAWMRNINYCLLILGTAMLAIFFKTYIKRFKVTLFIFDSLGLGLFTMVGVQKGIVFGLEPGICVALGTITGCFGGVIRDILLTTIPSIFRTDKELYATVCIMGGSIYFGLLHINLEADLAKLIVITFIFIARIIVVRLKLTLPRIGY
ncbi:MAG: trimeric intracellular cation channel family protein [Pedobacter sp.]|nr:trimeric intracellular cation channel family protein [Pedobacter sp.]MDQ8054088.1 trimeric intracellular cation channel family protein [Pedobacter sp.]